MKNEQDKTLETGLDVFADIQFATGAGERGKWSKIGSGKKMLDGTIELTLNTWPTNTRRLHVQKKADECED